jgi:phage gpG-like protein
MAVPSSFRKELVNFSLEAEGKRELDIALSMYQANIHDLRGVWPDVDEYLRTALRQLFEKEGARGGPRWAKLTKAYKAWKDSNYPGRPILVLTGALKESLTEEDGDHIFEPDRLGMTLGTSVPYARYHQTGTRTMRPRPPIRFLRKEDGVAVARLMMEYIFKSGQGYKRAQVRKRV